jgi:hypothetical protein
LTIDEFAICNRRIVDLQPAIAIAIANLQSAICNRRFVDRQSAIADSIANLQSAIANVSST